MLFEKNTLFGLLVLWFTGCSAVSPGHWPFCARASSSVPGAPASSLATGSQVLVLKPGVGAAGLVCAEAFAEALGTSQASVVAAIAAAAQGTVRARRIRRITGHSC